MQDCASCVARSWNVHSHVCLSRRRLAPHTNGRRAAVLIKLERRTGNAEAGLDRRTNAFQQSFVTNLRISGGNGGSSFELRNVYTSDLRLAKQTVDVQDLQRRFKHLRNLPIPKDDEPIAEKTKLGWVVYGKTNPTLNYVALSDVKKQFIPLTTHQLIKSENDMDLEKVVRHHLSTEAFGASVSSKKLVSAEDRRALDIMEQTLKFNGLRYEIGLLWRRENVALPDSWRMAMWRLMHQEKALNKTPELLEWKNNHVKSLLEKNYLRQASTEELASAWPRIWYCPTFVTINKNKIPPKPRDVADVAATVNGHSLNTNLLKGPDNLIPLFSGLFKFRENAIAVNADVREMFHQIVIAKEDQQCQRILWRFGNVEEPPTVFIMQVMMFGPKCSPSCAQYVKNTHAEKYLTTKPEAAKGLIKSTYVDDYFNSHETVDEAERVTKDAIQICADMGFPLVGAQSNSRDLLSRLPTTHLKNPQEVDLEPEDESTSITKVLGMFWNSVRDIFVFKMFANDLVEKMLTPDYVPTKREDENLRSARSDCPFSHSRYDDLTGNLARRL